MLTLLPGWAILPPIPRRDHLIPQWKGVPLASPIKNPPPGSLRVTVPRMFRIEATGSGIEHAAKMLPLLVFAGVAAILVFGGLAIMAAAVVRHFG